LKLFANETLGKKAAAAAKSELQGRRAALRCYIENYRLVQQQYFPFIEEALFECSRTASAPSDDSDTYDDFVTAEDHPLLLPSSFPDHYLAHCSTSLRQKELQIRVAQCEDSLELIRRNLRVRQHHFRSGLVNVDGDQGPNTQARAIIMRRTTQIDAAAAQYKAARDALIRLDANHESLKKLRFLEKHDIQFPKTGREDEIARLVGSRSIAGVDKSYRDISWIWSGMALVDIGEEGNKEAEEVLCVEWCKARSRVQRWGEEVDLLVEEMRRVVTYFSWKARWWHNQKGRRSDCSIHVQRGLAAFAFKQAAMFSDMSTRCTARWDKTVREAGRQIKWATALAVTTGIRMEVDEEGTSIFIKIAAPGLDYN
jgi:hypothetical protein